MVPVGIKDDANYETAKMGNLKKKKKHLSLYLELIIISTKGSLKRGHVSQITLIQSDIKMLFFLRAT